MRIILCHLCLSIARLDLEQRSYVLERRGVLLQLGVTDGEVVQVVSLVRLVTVLRVHKQYEGMKDAHSNVDRMYCPYVMRKSRRASIFSPEIGPPAELFPS